MAKVITFSRYFPAYHPKAGQPTYFVEALWKSRSVYIEALRETFYEDMRDEVLALNKHLPYGLVSVFFKSIDISYNNDANRPNKIHTMRSGHRWEVGDKVSCRIWTGKPYASKQLIIMPEQEILKTQDVFIDDADHWIFQRDDVYKQDGFTDKVDFRNWFNKLPFEGQILHLF